MRGKVGKMCEMGGKKKGVDGQGGQQRVEREIIKGKRGWLLPTPSYSKGPTIVVS